MSIIEVNHVTKEYQLGTIQSLKTTALNQWRRLTGQPVEERTPFKALDDVTFLVEEGEVADIFCTNGAGKSNENSCLPPLICSLIYFHHPDAPSRN
jgi:ABC-type polysaccharide/polyol phosphate transport system ATPase subunit